MKGVSQLSKIDVFFGRQCKLEIFLVLGVFRVGTNSQCFCRLCLTKGFAASPLTSSIWVSHQNGTGGDLGWRPLNTRSVGLITKNKKRVIPAEEQQGHQATPRLRPLLEESLEKSRLCRCPLFVRSSPSYWNPFLEVYRHSSCSSSYYCWQFSG